LTSLSLAKRRSSRLEICKVCKYCGIEFLSKSSHARFCSRNCYRRYIRKNPILAKRDRVRKLEYWISSAGRASYRRVANKIELRKAIRLLIGVQIRTKTDVASLYEELVQAVNKNKIKAKRIFKGGIPDAVGSNVEFKFYLDSLRAAQLVLDILGNCKGKIRWVPSYDSLEKTLSGGENESRLFDSYLEYLLACERTKTFDFK
jgi:hypothetical protein